MAVSFTGHIYDESGKIKNWRPIGLKDQIADKLEYIEKKLLQDPDIVHRCSENVKLIFIGHSIGCYTILELLTQFSANIKG